MNEVLRERGIDLPNGVELRRRIALAEAARDELKAVEKPTLAEAVNLDALEREIDRHYDELKAVESWAVERKPTLALTLQLPTDKTPREWAADVQPLLGWIDAKERELGGDGVLLKSAKLLDAEFAVEISFQCCNPLEAGERLDEIAGELLRAFRPFQPRNGSHANGEWKEAIAVLALPLQSKAIANGALARSGRVAVRRAA